MKINIDSLKENASKAIDKSKVVAKDAKNLAVKAANVSRENASVLASKASAGVEVSKEKIIKAMDQNGDGELTIEDVIIAGLKVPGIKIKRDEFLKKEFSTNYSKEAVEKVLSETPANANIPSNEIDKIADNVIQYERLRVSGISAALSTPGGIAMVATLPTDIAQYYGYMLRAAQKLLYLYGFPEIDINSEQLLDSATMNTIIVCMGVMYGVAGANTALKTMAKALGKGVEKKLINTALTKGTIYPIVKSTAKWFNVRMTKEMFAGFFKNSIPVVGGVIGGGITYATFKPCCERLKNTLKETRLANPNVNDSNLEDLSDQKEN